MLIPYGKHFIDGTDVKSVSKALNAPLITQGPTISRFEKAVCKLLKVKYAVAVNSCTSGLQIAIQAAQKKKWTLLPLRSPLLQQLMRYYSIIQNQFLLISILRV